MRVIAGDVGGTKTLLRTVEGDGTTSSQTRYESGAYPTFDEMLRDFMQRVPGPVDAACFAVAGPVVRDRAEITNLHWVMESQELSRSFGIPLVSLVNDFYAVAIGVPLLAPSDLLSLQQGERDRTAPIGILGAGTGLGEAFLMWTGEAHQVIPSEGGHGDFAPQNEEQTGLFLHLHQRYGHVSWERLVSGMGLVNIFTFFGGEEVPPAEVARRCQEGDPTAVRTIGVFLDLYGAEAGNMALRVLARGGIFLAGGVTAKNAAYFTDGRFIEAFLRKGRFRPLLEKIPVDLVLNQEVGLMGAAAVARRLAASP